MQALAEQAPLHVGERDDDRVERRRRRAARPVSACPRVSPLRIEPCNRGVIGRAAAAGDRRARLARPRGSRSSCSAAGSRTATSRSTSPGASTCCASAGTTRSCSASTATPSTRRTCSPRGSGSRPEVIAFVEPEGYLVTRYIRGTPVSAERDARPRDDPQRGADAAALPQQRLDRVPLRPLPRRRGLLQHRRGRTASRSPKAYDRAKPIADMIERLRPPHPTVLCHNDLLNANFIADENGRIWIVDWEYAGMGDRFFDLANFSVNHGLDEEDDALLLASYGVEERALAACRCGSCPTSARRCGASCSRRSPSSTSTSRRTRAEHFERMEETADSDRFRAGAACDGPCARRRRSAAGSAAARSSTG